MTSCGPYSEPLDFKFMYQCPDATECKPVFNKHSITDVLFNTPNYSHFANIVKNADLAEKFSNPDIKHTLFITSDEYISPHIPAKFFTDIDKSSAYHLLQGSTLPKIIPTTIMTSDASIYLTMDDTANRLLIMNNGHDIVVSTWSEYNPGNQATIVKGDIKCSNGMIHVLNDLILPVPFM